jgi:hypothetical protein
MREQGGGGHSVWGSRVCRPKPWTAPSLSLQSVCSLLLTHHLLLTVSSHRRCQQVCVDFYHAVHSYAYPTLAERAGAAAAHAQHKKALEGLLALPGVAVRS